MSAVYLIVCENEKEGEFSCKESSPLLVAPAYHRAAFYAPMMIGTNAAQVMHISMPVQNE